MTTAPEILCGKKKVFEEVFVCPNTQKTEEKALQILREVRTLFSHEDGWLEIWADIEEIEPGKWQVSRCQAQYSGILA